MGIQNCGGTARPRHQWRHGDMVIWDNRSVMHQANPDYDMSERRYLYRLMLKGTAPVPA